MRPSMGKCRAGIRKRRLPKEQSGGRQLPGEPGTLPALQGTGRAGAALEPPGRKVSEVTQRLHSLEGRRLHSLEGRCAFRGHARLRIPTVHTHTDARAHIHPPPCLSMHTHLHPCEQPCVRAHSPLPLRSPRCTRAPSSQHVPPHAHAPSLLVCPTHTRLHPSLCARLRPCAPLHARVSLLPVCIPTENHPHSTQGWQPSSLGP